MLLVRGVSGQKEEITYLGKLEEIWMCRLELMLLSQIRRVNSAYERSKQIAAVIILSHRLAEAIPLITLWLLFYKIRLLATFQDTVYTQH